MRQIDLTQTNEKLAQLIKLIDELAESQLKAGVPIRMLFNNNYRAGLKDGLINGYAATNPNKLTSTRTRNNIKKKHIINGKERNHGKGRKK